MAEELQVTELLRDWKRGNEDAFGKLKEFLEKELRKMARGKLKNEGKRPFHTTELMNEAYQAIIGKKDIDWDSRRHFFGAAAAAMRCLLVDAARKRSSIKHGGSMERVAMFEEFGASLEDPDKILAVNQALTELKKIMPDAEKVISLRFFAGYTTKETASLLGISIPTADRRWALAKAWLFKYLSKNNHEEKGA